MIRKVSFRGGTSFKVSGKCSDIEIKKSETKTSTSNVDAPNIIRVGSIKT